MKALKKRKPLVGPHETKGRQGDGPEKTSLSEMDNEEDDSAFGKLKRDLAERERIKAHRKREMDRETAVIARTRGEGETTGMMAYLDVEILPSKLGEETAFGRMIFELFEDVVPRTVKNFVSLVEGHKGDSYIGTAFYRVEPGKACTCGDVEHKNDGTGGRSIYGRDFEDENYTLKHTNAGVLTMYSRRPNSNNSQFQILFAERPDLDGRQVVFGRLVEGFAILREIEKLGSQTGVPTHVAKIKACALIDRKPTVDLTLQAYQAPLILPKPKDDAKAIARNYRNKTKYYDTSTRSALFSWTTSC